MAAPVDPYDFQNLVSIVDAAQVNLRFKRLFDALDKTKIGLDGNSFKDGAFTAAKFPAAQAWQTVALGGVAWTPASLSFYKDQVGIVRLRSEGLVTVGTMARGMLLATLPAGYRPGAGIYINLWRAIAYQTPGLAVLGADGTIVVDDQPGSIFTAGTWVIYGAWRAEN